MKNRYKQFKDKVFENKDQLRDMLKLLYNVNKLRPLVVDAFNLIDQVERVIKTNNIKANIVRLSDKRAMNIAHKKRGTLT